MFVDLKSTKMATKKITKGELTDMLKRLQAEFENYRKRKEKEIEKIREHSNRELIYKLLNIMDNMELALKSKDDKSLRQGLEMIYSQLVSVLEKEGLEKIKDNKNFNPELHEAVITEKSEKEDGTILEVFQPGYKLKGKVIRTAKVRVAKNDK